ncbi:hypothetical protein J2T10_000087 [Paenarthrobacter nicotinovorans]|uniref:Uncharacterized protein n=1 Tax=Paenarthrobacter nicotinovorans TaxID=29320 RepID=A0ABT9THR1_PAENI|nr:hypothetical protein [Paenarthrobacter nicotinovorans]MDQ0100468.1 hypothetical protein [Paenarthrobacter nicotinovorans]
MSESNTTNAGPEVEPDAIHDLIDSAVKVGLGGRLYVEWEDEA